MHTALYYLDRVVVSSRQQSDVTMLQGSRSCCASDFNMHTNPHKHVHVLHTNNTRCIRTPFKLSLCLTYTNVHTDLYICIPSEDESDRRGMPKNTSTPRITHFQTLESSAAKLFEQPWVKLSQES